MTRKKNKLVLYISGMTPTALHAIENLRALIEELGSTNFNELEIVDITKNPELAEEHRIMATPMVMKHLPEPMRRLVGDLSNREQVLLGLELLAND